MAASALNVVEQSVLHFLHLWDLGLQPSLNISTNSDGSFVISSSVTSLPSSHSTMRRTSGNNSRQRRQRKCSHLQPNSSNTDVNSNQTSLNNLADVTTESTAISMAKYDDPEISEVIVPASQNTLSDIPKLTFQTQST